MVRYLRPAAFSAAALVLLLATDTSAAPGGRPGLAGVAGRLPPAGWAAAATAARAAPPGPTRAAAPAAPPPPPTVLPDPGRDKLADPTRGVFTGSGFDACSAPPLDTMRAWRGASPYGAIGIYSSGRQRACDQPRLTADWVRQVRALGWRLLPIHAGRQAPCAAPGDRQSQPPSRPQLIDPAHAVQQGREEAGEAVKGARRIGIGQGAPIYLDLEAYPPGNAGCAKAVVDFTLGWTQALHTAGYFAGFYSSLDSSITDLAAAARAGAAPLPDAVWYAHWDDRASTDGGGVLGADQWARHRRAHQQHGTVQETHGGARLEIDRDQLDTLVAR
ncbi:glycoside hydrolase domain-containing protein [Kitasatospora sp. NPDC008050]|uniref:glycoside hydrolase domain-containing protein n=1 Tax=Kitasatospora sp. NPDC008050 TaxID=3364021 RepID=UPI0036E78DA7